MAEENDGPAGPKAGDPKPSDSFINPLATLRSALLNSEINRDIYSVKEWDGAVGAYSHVAMYRSPQSALRKVRDLKHQRLASGYSDDVKMCHPANWVVQAFVLAGNRIED